jgi:predicted nucleic acid-binding protein
MRVIDTSAWIEYLRDSAPGRKFASEIPRRNECIVPTIVQMELAKWLAREVGEILAEPVLAFTMECQVVPLDTAIALLAAEIGRERRLATADAIIYATALAHDAELVTCDAHFKDLPGVIYFAKVNP